MNYEDNKREIKVMSWYLNACATHSKIKIWFIYVIL